MIRDVDRLEQRELLHQAGIRRTKVEASVGAGTGFYRIGVEFAASLAGRLAAGLYLPVKGVVSLLCYPFKWLDGWLQGGVAHDRIPGGYLAVGRKPDESN